jgi:SAM-dependent methyltransferase
MIDGPYGAFAYAYDKALGERYFRAVRRRLDEVLERFPAGTKTHLDVACGTGLAMRHFARRGFVTTGVDISMPMLQMARARAPRLIAGDARAMPLSARFARVTCLYDALNHMLDESELAAVFREIARVMDDDALFIFDMNHPDIYPVVWGMKEPFTEEGEDFALEIATTWHPRKRLGRALVRGWRRLPGGQRVEIRERHEQRSYDEPEITAALTAASLRALETVTFDPYGEGRPVKLFCVAARA